MASNPSGEISWYRVQKEALNMEANPRGKYRKRRNDLGHKIIVIKIACF